MVGLSGVVGTDAAEHDPETIPPTVAGGETDTAYRDANIAVHAAFHAGTTVDQPVETAGGSLLWVWGEVYSVTDDRRGRRTVDPNRTADVCAAEYAEHGTDFVSRLDGEFVGCIYDPTADTATFFIDRLGARPLYFAVGDDRFAFSTNVQTVPEPPDVGFGFDDAFLSEYLYARRVFGTKTPVSGIEQLPPATVLTYDLGTGAIDHHQYWEPRYRPVSKPFDYFVREFADRFERAVADRTADEGDHGLLLSGGSDSRAVLAAADAPLTTFHLGDGPNREAKIARRSAATAGASFDRLDRGPDYHARLLERAAPIMEFIGPFHTGHALGFAERIAGEVDTLLTGLYSDDLFGAWSVPQQEIDLPFGVTLYPPFVDRPTSGEEFVAAQLEAGPTRQPPYLTGPPYGDVLRANLRTRDGRVDFHGVAYESITQLAMNSSLFPITNGIGFDLYSALQIAPTRNPFLDRRLVDLHLSMPLRYRLRHDLVYAGIRSLSPALARIPHSSTRLPLSYPKAAHVVGTRVSNQFDKLDRPRSYRTGGPWQDKNEVIRQHDLVGDALDANEDTLDSLSCIDPQAAREMYRSHRSREMNVAEELYRLVTVLEMPLTKRLVGREQG
ncbi:asparagine synthase-related protein [Halalkalicoccus subterraneus]|uniref:asparagine synthase-related protein n=1 Tax=Halalkalicoccus subterraneus TaxID=2675002 RepID=UPI000EFC710F|nr:asparagine synthase-related protein [Halalkalicoccus subterraneus]